MNDSAAASIILSLIFIKFFSVCGKNEKTILVYKVLFVKFRINSAKQVNLSVNGELRRKGATD
jgi:hypothetical protein